MPQPSLGLEEEFFVLYAGQPSTASLLSLAALLWREPRWGMRHTASNFTRGRRAWSGLMSRSGLMSSVEISSGAHRDPSSLLAEVAQRRAQLSGAFKTGLLVPVGLLPDSDAYHTAGLHLHIGVEPAHRERAYGNLARFLPVLALASASSPWWDGREAGPMNRVRHSFALGPLQASPLARFQDLIVTRRLGTIELRVLDPVWDLARLRAIVDAAWQLAAYPVSLPWSRETYNRLREAYPQGGLSPELEALALELQELTGFDPRWAREPESDRLALHARRHGHADVWRHLDGALRAGAFTPSQTPHARPARWRGAAGLAGYFVPRLPYMAYKAWAEHHGAPRTEGASATPRARRRRPARG